MQFEVQVKTIKRCKEDNGNGSTQVCEHDAYVIPLEREPNLQSTREEVYAR